MTTDAIKTISTTLPTGEVLAQLAEEAAELAQAALKLRRAMTGINPTPVSQMEGAEDLVEEIADVIVCERVLNERLGVMGKAHAVVDGKVVRWARRLEGNRE